MVELTVKEAFQNGFVGFPILIPLLLSWECVKIAKVPVEIQNVKGAGIQFCCGIGLLQFVENISLLVQLSFRSVKVQNSGSCFAVHVSLEKISFLTSF